MLPTVLLNCTRKNPVVGRSQRCSRLLPLGSHQTCAGWQSSIRVLFPGLSEVSFAGRSSGGGKNPFYSKKTAWCLVVDGGTVMGSLFASANRVLVLIEKGKKITKQPRKKQKHTKKTFSLCVVELLAGFHPRTVPAAWDSLSLSSCSREHSGMDAPPLAEWPSQPKSLDMNSDL